MGVLGELTMHGLAQVCRALHEVPDTTGQLRCTLHAGHSGRDHVAEGPEGQVMATWENESKVG